MGGTRPTSVIDRRLAVAATLLVAGVTIDPCYSPNGRRIAFSSNRDGDLEIFTARSNGTRLVQLTHNTALDTNPDWQRR
jgi:Tol biopolymer transport system component